MRGLKKNGLILLVVLVIFGGGGYLLRKSGFNPLASKPKAGTGGSPGTTPAPSRSSSPPAHDYTPEAAKLVGGLSTEAKVGQLFVVRRSAATASALGAGKVGGVIYFGDDLSSAAAIAQTSNRLQQSAVAAESKMPLLIAIDQEYGTEVKRLGSYATQFPGNMALGATQDLDLATSAAKAGGAEMKSLGINVDFAPDADVNLNPLNPVIGVRSFSDDPGLAAKLTAGAVQGYQSAGVAATAKHFPGHGDTQTDSHTGLPVIRTAADTFKRQNFPPFESAIKAGTDLIMAGHIKVTSLDNDRPASLSHKVLTDILRGDLGYKGVIVTDALEMQGVNIGLSQGQIAVTAFKAGADLLLMPKDLDTSYRAVLAAVKDGSISTKALNAAVTRIIALKLKLGLTPGHAPADARGDGLKAQAAQAICAQVAEKSLTLIAGQKPQLGDGSSVFVTGWNDDITQRLAKLYPGKAHYWTMGTHYTDADITQAVGKVTDKAAVVLVMNAPASDQMKYYSQLIATNHPVYVVLVGLPYAAAYTTKATGTIALYNYSDCSLQALVKALQGQQELTGKLPVDVPDASGKVKYPRGTTA